jgi:hypothetical protein
MAGIAPEAADPEIQNKTIGINEPLRARRRQPGKAGTPL